MLVSLRRLAADERGAVVYYVAMSIMALAVLALAALDFIRVQLVRSRVSYALDSAVLAGGRALDKTPAEWQADIQAYFNANMEAGYMGATIAPLTLPAATPSGTGTLVDASVTVSVPLLSTELINYGAFKFTASTQARRQNQSDTELVLVLDVTGSMEGSKLTAMQNAASTLITNLFGNNTGGANMYAGLVPFSQNVKIGTGRTGWLSSLEPYKATGSPQWKGCAFERNRNLDASSPSTSSFTPYYEGKSSSPKQTKCADSFPAVTFLNADSASMKTQIGKMSASGNTIIHLGLLWGWRMLDPAWSGLWDNSLLPQPYDPNLQKVIILLTDGDNTRNDLNAYNADLSKTTLDTMLRQTCANVKATNEITVFTITFGTNISSGTSTLMRNCATDSSHYYQAPSNSDLQTVFNSIAGRLSELRLTK